jgi:hypothetical protein
LRKKELLASAARAVTAAAAAAAATAVSQAPSDLRGDTLEEHSESGFQNAWGSYGEQQKSKENFARGTGKLA